MHIRIAYKKHLFDIIEACDINSYKNRELTEIQCKEVQKKMNRVSRDLDLVFFKNKIISRVYKTWNSCQKLPLLHTMISVAEFFFINQRFTIWKQRQRNTDIKYTLVIFMSTSTEAICQPKTLYESITLYVSIIPRAKTFIRQIHT